MALLGICPPELGRAALGFQEFPELLEAPHPAQLCPGATTPPIPSGALAEVLWELCPAQQCSLPQAGRGKHIQAAP